MNETQFEAMQQDPNTPGNFGSILSTMGLAGAILGVLWSWALPVFMLIWFARPAIRREVKGWGSAGRIDAELH